MQIKALNPIFKISLALFLLGFLYPLSAAKAAPSCLSTLKVGPKSAALSRLASTSVLLDFDGDGSSDIVSAVESSEKTTFNIRSSMSGTSSTIELPQGKPVPADYDGDLKWDAAVVNKNSRGIKWTIQLSSTGERVTRSFGRASSTVLSGCRFLSAGKYSLATFVGGKLQAVELGSSTKRTITFTALTNSKPIGCGDSTGDDVDELIMQTAVSPSSNDVSTVSCSNDDVNYGTREDGENLFVLNAGQGQIPVIGYQRFNSSNKTLIRLNQLYDKLRYPSFYIPTSAIFTFGKFSLPTSGSSLGLLWQNSPSRVVTRQLFSTPSVKETVATLGAKESLLKPQNIFGYNEIP